MKTESLERLKHFAVDPSALSPNELKAYKSITWGRVRSCCGTAELWHVHNTGTARLIATVLMKKPGDDGRSLSTYGQIIYWGNDKNNPQTLQALEELGFKRFRSAFHNPNSGETLSTLVLQ